MVRTHSHLPLTPSRVLLGLILLALAAGLLVWRLLPRDQATQVTVGQALAEFRRLADRDPARARPAAALPRPGVYSYAISGGESLDALLDAEHDYDGGTAIVVSRSGCGVEERWEVLRQRWSAVGICPVGGRLRLDWVREFHDFFGSSKSAAYACRPAARPGATSCRSGQDSIAYATRRLGTEPLRVGGRAYAAVHLRSHISLSGDSSGGGSSDEWRRVGDGLLLAKRFTVSASVASAGDAVYAESYRLRLRSPNPRR